MIFLHEFGHFIVARLCHIRVLEFAIGMGPKLFGFRSKKTDTLYALRLFPIGGYCSMLGENDDTIEDEHAFCRRPAWQRFLVAVAGAATNLLTAFLAMLLILGIDGAYISNQVSGFAVPSYGAGLAIGDVITEVNGKEAESQEDIDRILKESKTALTTLTVLRDGKEVILKDIGLLQAEENGEFYRVRDFVVGTESSPTEVTHYTAASARAGLMTGDEIVRVNGKKVRVYTDISWEIGLCGSEPCTLTVLRTLEDGTKETLTLSPTVFPVTSEDGVIFASTDFGLARAEFQNPFQFIARAFDECISTAKIVYRSLIELIAGRFGTAGMSGPIGAADTISDAAALGFVPLMRMFVIISINLGLMNLLPLPALDGGRLIFILLEMIRRKPINQKYEAIVHAVGMILLLGVMLFISLNDIVRLIGG